MTPTRFAASLFLIAALAAVTSACGRRGALEPPPSAAVLETADDGTIAGPGARPADKPFILDPLIK